MSSTVLPLAEQMEKRILALARAETPPEVFRALLEGTRLAAPRAAIFLARQGRLKGWGSVGFGAEAANRQRGMTLPMDSGFLGEVARDPAGAPRPREAAWSDPEFGQDIARAAIGIPIRVKERPIAILYAEQAGDGTSWLPPFLHSLVAVASIRLELDLLRRKVDGAPSAANAPTPAVATPAPPAPGPPRTSKPAPDDDLLPSVPLAVPETATAVSAATPARSEVALEEAPTVPDEDPVLEAARRFARLVATDIRLYNEDAVVQGRQAGDLAARLSEQLARGRETFEKRHGDLGERGVAILHEACVQVLASGDADLLPRSALDAG